MDFKVSEWRHMQTSVVQIKHSGETLGGGGERAEAWILTVSRWVRWCLARSLELLKAFWQPGCWHRYGFSPVWLLRWIFRFSRRENALLQPSNCGGGETEIRAQRQPHFSRYAQDHTGKISKKPTCMHTKELKSISVKLANVRTVWVVYMCVHVTQR